MKLIPLHRTARVVQNIHGQWTLGYYVNHTVTGYRQEIVPSLEAGVERARELGATGVYLNHDLFITPFN